MAVTGVSLCPPFLEPQKFTYTSSQPSDCYAPFDKSPLVFKILAVVSLPDTECRSDDSCQKYDSVAYGLPDWPIPCWEPI